MHLKYISRLLAAAAVLLLAASCVYPFSAETEDGSGSLVVDGDIRLGEYTTVVLRYSTPIETPKTNDMVKNGKVWVEDDRGRVFEGLPEPDSPGYYKVDTRQAAPGPKYRLCINNGDTGREYVSDWEEANPSPVIDSLSYILDYDRSKMDIAISIHSTSSSYFKWKYVEDWEYHTMYYASLTYIPPEVDRWGRALSNWNLVSSSGEAFTCWAHKASSEIMIFSTEKQTEDRFVDLEFHSIPRNDMRISQIYRIEVTLEPLTRDAYLYWDNVRTNSEYTGNLFAPTPSEMAGNIHCLQNPDEYVLGYVSVAQFARKILYVFNTEVRFYSNPTQLVEPSQIGPGQWFSYYKDGYLPYDYYRPGDISETLWLPDRCVDCRLMGGTTQKPDYWLKDLD